MNTYFATNRLTLGGEEYSVEIVTQDTQSDPVRAAEVTIDLIEHDGADLVLGQLAAPTPGTENPVSDTCEANAVPCITTAAPWQTTWFGRGKQALDDEPFDWSYHFFWGLEDVQAVFQDIWTQVGTNQRAGAVWPDDANGRAWGGAGPNGFAAAVGANGFTVLDPGFYQNGAQDFGPQITGFRDADADILLGVPLPPDFATFWEQAGERGYRPRVATIGRALLFPSSVEALGEAGDNVSTEVWWSPSHPFSSSLTGQSARELAEQYEQQTGQQWSQPVGFVHALFEVAVAALSTADGTGGQAVVDAMAGLEVSTVVGDVAWGSGPVPNVAKTPLVGGQWEAVNGGPNAFELRIVSNTLARDIPIDRPAQPLG